MKKRIRCAIDPMRKTHFQLIKTGKTCFFVRRSYGVFKSIEKRVLVPSFIMEVKDTREELILAAMKILFEGSYPDETNISLKKALIKEMGKIKIKQENLFKAFIKRK